MTSSGRSALDNHDDNDDDADDDDFRYVVRLRLTPITTTSQTSSGRSALDDHDDNDDDDNFRF